MYCRQMLRTLLMPRKVTACPRLATGWRRPYIGELTAESTLAAMMGSAMMS